VDPVEVAAREVVAEVVGSEGPVVGDRVLRMTTPNTALRAVENVVPVRRTKTFLFDELSR
jgi:hypothetical protein